MTENDNTINPLASKDGGTGFFAVRISVLHKIAIYYKNPLHVATYIVLSRHGPTRGNLAGLVSTAGTHAVSKKTGASRRIVNFVLNDLQSDGFVSKYAYDDFPDIPKHASNAKVRANEVRWVFSKPNSDTKLVYLPNGLTDGLGTHCNDPPLYKIMKFSGTAKLYPIKVRLDCLMVLIQLYYNDALEDCGGFDPRCGIYKRWGKADLGHGYSRGRLRKVDNVTFKILDSGSEHSKIYFKKCIVNAAMCHIDSDVERYSSFVNAFKKLNQHGFIYEVLQIWDCDPTKNKYANVMYPLYVFDRFKREVEPSFFRKVNAFIIKRFEMTPQYVNEYAGGCDAFFNNKYIYVEFADSPAYPLSVFRLKYKPNTGSFARWLEREELSIEEWSKIINELE